MLGMPQSIAILVLVGPDAVIFASEYGTSKDRKEHRLSTTEISYNTVVINNTLLYVVSYPVSKAPAMVGAWQDPGLIVSTRLAESLFPYIKNTTEMLWTGGLSDLPSPTWLAETSAHQALKERICLLMDHSIIRQDFSTTKTEDVFLYQTGMAAIYWTYQAAITRRPGTILVLGAVNHNTFHLLRCSKSKFKHFGQVDGDNDQLNRVEAWLDEEAAAGRAANKHNFVLVVDETIGSFYNVDVAPAADAIVTSLTKTFSGYADVMAGSVILSSSSPRYGALAKIFKLRFRNELFSLDATHLLKNNNDYLTRSAALNRNAASLAAYLHSQAVNSKSPVTDVLYPPYSSTFANYAKFQRPSTPDYSSGYGCLLSVNFKTQKSAEAFFDNLHFHGGPHLGAHRTLAIPFNATVWGSDVDEYPYHVGYGLREAQIRISVGLEETDELLQTVREACWHAERPKNHVLTHGFGGTSH
ncbi:hypothetical protein LTR84_007054 [Exophiala bonariae]|uniref:Cystathionine beta-lyase n=1 Tax=Exophiala bonariae TaxID=1690606 RepID=A0AAV9N0N3_9EURO|nr:hypothetical protein LTR84_007054 [Exophiala bonariae]